MTSFIHGVGLVVAALWMVRMLVATYRGRLHPVGGYGVGMLVLVLLFPVVHPWYALWAIIPLAAWANRALFRNTAVIYSIILSFFVLPRGLKLPAWSVTQTYIVAAVSFVVSAVLGYVILKVIEVRSPGIVLGHADRTHTSTVRISRGTHHKVTKNTDNRDRSRSLR